MHMPKLTHTSVCLLQLPQRRRHWIVRLFQNLNPVHWLSRNRHLEVGKKNLVKDNKDSLRMTLPFLLWGVLVIIIYAVSCKTLGTISTPLVQLDIARRAVAKVSRTLFVTNELCTQVSYRVPH